MLSKKIALHTTMRKLLRNCIYGLMLALAAGAYASELTASVDRDSIGARETLTLTLSAEGTVQNSPDFSGLKSDFDILSNQKSASTQIINGHSESSTDWQLTLAPKHTGKLLIPSFNIGNAVSDAIEINVSQQSQAPQTGRDEQVKTSIGTDKDSVYVQEQILVNIKLITEVGLSQAKFEPLDVKNAMVVDLGQKQYQTSSNGKPQLVVENSFAIFPQQSGELIIPSLTYEVVVEDGSSLLDRVYGRNRNRNNNLQLHTDEKRIQVKAIPAQSSSKTWQPALQLSLNETWSGSLDRLKIGEPITRTITITGDALTAGLIVPLANTEIEGLTFYPEQAQIKDNKSKNGVLGSRVETVAIIAHSGGDFILPAIDVDWWNTQTQKMERVSLPEKKLHVLGEVAKAQTPVAAQPPAPAATLASGTDSPPPPASNHLPAWILAIVGLLALVALALTIYIAKLKKNLRQLHQDQADRDNALQQKERDIWDALKATAATRDANALRKAVLNWAQFQWPSQRVNTLDDIAKLAVSEELTAALKALDEVLYSNHSDGEWDSGSLLKLLNEFRKQRKTEKKSPQLKNLYSQ